MLCRQVLLYRKMSPVLMQSHGNHHHTHIVIYLVVTTVTTAFLLHDRQTLCMDMVCGGGLIMRSQLLSCRSGKLTPSQVAKNIIAVLEDCDKSTPPLRAIVQWNQEQIMLVMSVRKGSSTTTRAVGRAEVLLICYTEKYVHFCFFLV